MKNRQTVDRALIILRDVMAPWLCQMIRDNVEGYQMDDETWWKDGIVTWATTNPIDQGKLAVLTSWDSRVNALDMQACCNVFSAHWKNFFSKILSSKALSWNKLVQAARNDVSHVGGTDFSDSETATDLDIISLLAGQIDERAQAEIQAMYREHVYGSREGSYSAGAGTKKPAGVKTDTPVSGLPCWRNVIKPHPDVAEGRYKKAEFAADLDQVARGEGSYEYRDPIEFFSRTYVTEGLKGLLVQALRRVGDKDGEPVIQLKTAFGGGKTHSMLALYHMLKGKASKTKLPHMKEVLEAAELDKPPICSVAVLVGTALDPTKARRPANMPGITINTIWGEMAAQLAQDAGNPKLYDIVKESDKSGVSPGKNVFKELFDACGPCVVLIDELVAYARKLYGKDSLPAGTYENLLTFVQELTEAARASKNSLVVASIPESKIEIGEEAGEKALAAIEHIFGRMESIWKPVAADEGFEIVRRRLFLDCEDKAARDAVCRKFSEMYQENSADFPFETKEVDYYERLKSCYPIHPEIFDRLYNDWATIEKFHKTRGVLRLMAAVIHNLWINGDGSLLIMPGSISLDEPAIRDELTRNVGDNWNAIIDHEVDGKLSIPYQKDEENNRFGSLMAARRVARTIMLGSAPSTRKDFVRGLEASRIRLGTIQPGENIAIFNDALSKLQNSLTYLYCNPSNDRYWYDTRPTLRKTAEDRASQRSAEEVEMEIVRRLRQIRREPPFGRIHICPESSLDVSDDMEVGLVFLKYRDTYKANVDQDPAIKAARDILDNRGSSPRIYRNMLAFVAPDENTISALKQEVKRFLAWKSIQEESEDLNLDATQNRETQNNLNMINKQVDEDIKQTYCHLLIPYIDKDVDLKSIIWASINLRGSDEGIVATAAKKMKQNAQLITEWAPQLLQMKLDELLWQDKDYIKVGDLWKMLCTYCYLDRLSDLDVLKETIMRGVNSGEYFGYAEGYDGTRYLGLKYKEPIPFIDMSGMLVKQIVALKQKAAEAVPGPGPVPPVVIDPPVDPPVIIEPPAAVHNKRFTMTATIDITRINRDIANLVDEVINHLAHVDGSQVEVKLLVDAYMPNGTPVNDVRTVTENCRTLRVDSCEFTD